jgi:hypothetical protein
MLQSLFYLTTDIKNILKQNSVYTVHQHWTRWFILKMAATELLAFRYQCCL